MLKRHGVAPPVVMESASTTAIKRFVENGVGMAILSQQVVAKGAAGWVAPPGPASADAEIAYHFYLIRHKDRWVSRALQAFVEMARSFQLQAEAAARPRRRQPRRGRGR